MTRFYSKCQPRGAGNMRIRLLLPAVLLLLTTAVFPHEAAYGAAQHKPVTISMQDVGYAKVFEEITRQSGYTFLYNNVQLDANARVSVDEKERPVSEVLGRLFSGTGLSYTMVGGQIVLTRRQDMPQRAQRYDIVIRVVDGQTGEPVVGATCHIANLGIFAVADNNGEAAMKNVAAGENNLEIRMLGYREMNTAIRIGPSTEFTFRMETVSLGMDEVVVLGTRTANTLSTSTTINRQAIDHLQAVSLSDLLELLPGQGLRSGQTMRNAEQLSFRTLRADANNSFGAAVLIDGVQLSNNATLDGHTSVTSPSTTGRSIDLRAIGTDNIESVEVILGLPSAEYGDLTSGAMVVKTSVGESPLSVRGKINPGIKQASAGKGWRIGENNTTVNMNLDYARASGDPREKSVTMDRVNASVGLGKNFTPDWRTNTRFRFSTLIDWQGDDPDLADSGTEWKSKNYNFVASHDGIISVNSLLSRTISYNFALQYSDIDQYQTNIITTGQSIYSLYNATETGYHKAVLLPSSYKASGGTKSRPVTLSGKITNQFFVDTEGFDQRFNMGVDYRYEKNYGIGNYNDDDLAPLNREQARERSFRDVPALHQLSAFLEDNVETNLFGRPLKAQVGVRFSSLQPFMDEFVFGISPRVNIHYGPADWLTLRGSFGKTQKTPGMTHLYPEAVYHDHRVAAYLSNDPAEQLVMYHTDVLQVPYNKMKNVTSTRWGAGFDIKLPGNVIFSVDAFRDYTPNGYESAAAYYGYYLRTYSAGNGLTPRPGQQPTVDFLDLGYSGGFENEGIVYASRGLTGNTAHSRNQGIEFSFDLGRIKAINTSIFFSGAYMESESWSEGRSYSNPVGGTLSLGTTDTPPFKLEYPSGKQKYTDKLFRTNLRLVCNIPQLRMVASAALQMTWWTYSRTTRSAYAPIGYFKYDYIDGQVVENYYPITDAMIADENYLLDDADGNGVLLRDQLVKSINDRATIQPPLFMFNVRLTKNFSDFAGFSFYANNTSFYQPWQHNNKSTTLSERNPNLEFGFELSFKF